MLRIEPYASLDKIKPLWQLLENKVKPYPFTQWWYQNLYTRHFVQTDKLRLLGIFDHAALLAVGAFEVVHNKAIFLGMKPVLGKEEVTDFGDLLIDPQAQDGANLIWQKIIEHFKESDIKTLQLDYVREDSTTHIALKKYQPKPQETSPFIQLPDSWEEYLSGLPRVKRKELKRKIHRLEEEQAFQVCEGQINRADFDDFIRLHRLSDPAKEKFMSEPMKAFFGDMVNAPMVLWQPQLCFLTIDHQRVASVLSFANSSTLLMYNSGFDPNFSYYSVGLLLKAFVIKESIKSHLKAVDFLRGSERYKYDLGGKDHWLWQIHVIL